MCHAYVYDTICRPSGMWFINHKRATQHAEIFTPEFVRIAFTRSSSDYLILLFAEAGGIDRTCCYFPRNPILLSKAWVKHQLKEIGDLDEIHFNHAGVHASLRIRIPKSMNTDDLYA